MSLAEAAFVQPASVIVVANEKGGSGKSTIAMHIAIALLKRGRRVATVDLDARQKSFTHYIENRRAWAGRIGSGIACPDHISIDDTVLSAAVDEMAVTLGDTIEALRRDHDTIVIDTPGHDTPLLRLTHAMADILLTPVNDSFVDLDVLGSLDAETLSTTGIGHYAATVDEARKQRRLLALPEIDWFVVRNRLSMLSSRNKRQVGAGLQELAGRLGFRCIDGMAERVVFREYFLRGLTAVDDLNQSTLGTRPTMTHVTARQEVESLLDAMNLFRSAGDPLGEASRDAA